MRENINRKILARLDDAVNTRNLPPRSDMYLADVSPIDDMKSNILIGYDAHLAGAPQISQIEKFVKATWNNTVVAQTTTARDHEGSEAVSILVTLNADTRSVADAAVMQKIMAGTFVDETTGHVWVVADSGTKKYLMRRPDKAISAILGEPVRHSRKQACFSKLKTAAPMPTEGDKVRFWDGAMPMVGKVSSIKEDSVSVAANGRNYSVSPDAIFNVVERSSTRLSGDKNNLENFFSRAFGSEEFARNLTRKLNREDDTLSGDTGFSGTIGDNKGSED